MKLIVEYQLDPSEVVNVSGIGCSGRTASYIDTYGIHSLHGRAISIALGLRLANSNLKIFIESGDGDSLSIGTNHLIHGIHKNFNCVFLLFDNGLYGLTKSQTSPTTRKGHKTPTNPKGTVLEPLNPLSLALGAGSSFVATSADWLSDHLLNTMKLAFDHQGFSFVHISQRCPYYDPGAFDLKDKSWFTFLEHSDGIPIDKRLTGQGRSVEHNPKNFSEAMKRALENQVYFGLIYRNEEKPCYDEILRKNVNPKPASLDNLLDPYLL